MNLKKKIFNLLEEGKSSRNKWNKVIDIFIISLIMLSIVEIILESFEEINLKYGTLFRIFEIFTVAIFSLEYILRIWIADLQYPDRNKISARFKFIFSTTGLIDLIAILPFYLPFFLKFDLRFIRMLRIVRLLIIFKLNRYTKAMKLIARVFKKKRIELGVTIFVTFLLMLLSSTIMYHLENEVQPDKFPNIIATFWWAIATLTTVGYGDVYPITGWGQFISGGIALLTIGLVALPTGIISAGFIEEMERKQEKSDKDLGCNCCPHCGEIIWQSKD